MIKHTHTDDNDDDDVCHHLDFESPNFSGLWNVSSHTSYAFASVCLFLLLLFCLIQINIITVMFNVTTCTVIDQEDNVLCTLVFIL